jgi:hypothetical protein
MALRARAVSIRVSPLRTEDWETPMVRTCAPSLARELEGGLGAGGGLEEQVDLGEACERVAGGQALAGPSA